MLTLGRLLSQIFVAPYDCLECSRSATTHWVTQQIGPHIYTQDGVCAIFAPSPGLCGPTVRHPADKDESQELIWSGIRLFPDKKMFDFRAVLIDGEYHLAAVTPQDADWHPFPDGAAMILDSSYNLIHNFTSTDLGNRIDLHEFNILEDGRTVLIGVKEARDSTTSESDIWKGKVMESYTMEIDLHTREPAFLWKASEHVGPSESTNPPPRPGDQHQHWDWLLVRDLAIYNVFS